MGYKHERSCEYHPAYCQSGRGILFLITVTHSLSGRLSVRFVVHTVIVFTMKKLAEWHLSKLRRKFPVGRRRYASSTIFQLIFYCKGFSSEPTLAVFIAFDVAAFFGSRNASKSLHPSTLSRSCRANPLRRLEHLHILVFSIIMIIPFLQILHESAQKLMSKRPHEAMAVPPVTIEAWPRRWVLEESIGSIAFESKLHKFKLLLKVQSCRIH
jgi:hypothetical protein